MRELFERVAVPCALRSTQGGWLAGRRLMAVDGFGLEAPDSQENAAYFGYAGKKERCAFPFVRMAALAECGTHAVVAAAIAKDGEGEETMTSHILSGGAVTPGMIVMADAGLYSYKHLRMVIDAGVDALFRVGANVGLPVLEWLPDGSYLSFIAEPAAKMKNSYRLRRGLSEITDLPGTYVRAVDYEITDRGDGEEIITLVTNITDPADVPAPELAAAYHQRWEAELVFDELKTRQRGSGVVLRSRKPELVEQEIWGLLLTHYGIRHLMREAADQAGLIRTGCPSYAHSASSAARLPGRRLFPPRRLAAATREAIEEILERPNPPRRERSCPRAVKRALHNVHPMKKPAQKNIHHNSPPTIRLLHPAA